MNHSLLHYLFAFVFFIGLLYVLKTFFYLVCYLINFLKSKILSKNLKSYGNTVIITGCTDGIGKYLAHSLIKENVNLFLISRNEEKLIKIKNDLLEKNANYEGNIYTLAFDYDQHNFSSYKIIEDRIKNLDVGILINNVGASYSYPSYYHETGTELIEKLVNVNLMSSYFMTKIVLPIMIKKKKGLILFTSSAVTALQSCPLYTIYVSVKDAICSFANSLSVELKEYNIKVQCHIPFYIVTKLSKIKNPSLFVPTPDKYAKIAIKKMKDGNIFPNHVISSPFFFHKLQIYLYSCIPKFFFDLVTIKHLKTVRKKALKKMEKNS